MNSFVFPFLTVEAFEDHNMQVRYRLSEADALDRYNNVKSIELSNKINKIITEG